MYQIRCRNWDHAYTGESKRTLKVRMAEHKWAVQKSDHNNGIAVPVVESHHSIDWAEARLVRSGQGYWEKRLTMETIQIKRSKGLRFSSVWNPGSTKLNHPATLTATLTLAIIISALLGPCHVCMITSGAFDVTTMSKLRVPPFWVARPLWECMDYLDGQAVLRCRMHQLVFEW